LNRRRCSWTEGYIVAGLVTQAAFCQQKLVVIHKDTTEVFYSLDTLMTKYVLTSVEEYFFEYPNRRDTFYVMQLDSVTGRAKQLSAFVKGKLLTSIEYFENGQIKLISRYEVFGMMGGTGSRKSGIWSYFNKEGRIVKQEYWVKGRLKKKANFK
jgi:hypothetical protein